MVTCKAPGFLGAFRKDSRMRPWSGVQLGPRPTPSPNHTPTEGCTVSRAIGSHVGRWTCQSLQLLAHLGGREYVEAWGRWDPWAAPLRLAPTHLQEVIAETLVAFEGRPAGEVARPEHVGAVGIGEEVILLYRPAAAEALRESHYPQGMHTPLRLPRSPTYQVRLALFSSQR